MVHRRRLFVSSLAVAGLVGVSAVGASAQTTAAKSGARCTKAGVTSGSLTCTKKAGRLVWAKSAATPAAAGFDGVWKPTAESKVGYRAKEVLFGQKTEGVGQTNAVTGTMTIAGTKVSAVELVADLTKLASSESRRDGQVQGRILETAKYPTAKLKLLKPIDLGKTPADGVELAQKGSVELTVKDVTKTVPIDVSARRKGATIEVAGSIPMVWAEWGIADPSFGGQIVVEPNGLMEFLVVFAK